MAGPYRLTTNSVRNHVRSDWAGVYLLRNSRSGPPRYVGRSDSDVRRRLLNQARKSDYRYFTVEHKRSAREAWHREAHLYHYHKSSLDNERHPPPPAGMSCPKCSAV